MLLPRDGHVAVALEPRHRGLEVAQALFDALETGTSRSWAVVWKEVLVGQTWALLGPFRLADGAGRLADRRRSNV